MSEILQNFIMRVWGRKMTELLNKLLEIKSLQDKKDIRVKGVWVK